MDRDYEQRIALLEKQLAEAKCEVNSLKLAVRAENIKVRISSEYSNFGLWEYDIADDICYQYKKLNGIYESHLEPISSFRNTIISWGSIYADDIPVFHRFCDAMERGDKELRFDVRVINDYSEIVWFRYEGKTVFDDNGVPVSVVGRTLDVTEEKGGIEISERHDALTGALLYSEFTSEAASRAAESGGFKNSALVAVGLDAYSELEASADCDTDAIQRSLAKVLEAQSAVEQGSLFSRMQDGVFVMYVKFSDIPNLNTIVSRIIYRFNDFSLKDDSSGRNITASAGISIFKYKKEYDDVLEEAMIALEAARLKGGNGYVQYTAALGAKLREDKGAHRSYELVSGAVGAERIYHLINTALSDSKNSRSAIAEAICESGSYTSATCVYICDYGGGGSDVELSWCADDKQDDTLPAVTAKYSKEKMAGILSEHKHIVLAESVVDNTDMGFELANGAKSAMCCPIYCGNDVAGYIAYVADKPVTWQKSDVELIDILTQTLSSLCTAEYADEHRKIHSDFVDAMMNNVAIEGFTIEPHTYVVDYIGERAARNYDLRKGDKCYRVLRGLEEPCADCPVHQLEAGQLSASCAYYSQYDNRWLDISASPYETLDGAERYAISLVDITGCINKVHSRDSLTGVMGFDQFAVDAMRITAENPENCFISVINIANFRRLNEEKGYEFGNSVLIAVADILSATLGAGELLCRSEGARFVALYRNANSNDLMMRLKQMLSSAQSQVFEKCGMQIYLISGVYELNGENIGVMSALDRAIIAQKTIKDKAYYIKNMIAFYDSELRDELQTRQYIESHMMEALENDEFKVYYQPKVNTVTGEIEGAEALVRWIRPNGEMISPAKFVPVFEKNGFIADMDFAIYRRAIADIRRWMRDGKEVPMISLNVSRQHMMDEVFPDKICALVDNLGVPRNKIELEITESMLTENMNRLLDAMAKLKNAGFRISVDDFGSGYSSLNLITLMPFDTLKIDGGFFLRNKLTDKNKTVITTIVELAKNLNFTTVSEGVETDEQVEFLRDLGCDLIQGYYYYKPMPVVDFEGLIK